MLLYFLRLPCSGWIKLLPLVCHCFDWIFLPSIFLESLLSIFGFYTFTLSRHSYIHAYLLHVCVNARVLQWDCEDNLRDSVLSFHVCPREELSPTYAQILKTDPNWVFCINLYNFRLPSLSSKLLPRFLRGQLQQHTVFSLPCNPLLFFCILYSFDFTGSITMISLLRCPFWQFTLQLCLIY